MAETLKSILELTGGKAENLPDGADADAIEITGVSGLQNAHAGDVSFFKDQKFTGALARTGASAVLAPAGLSIQSPPCPVVRVENVDIAFNMVINMFVKSPLPAERGIDSKAEVSPTAEIAENVYIGPFVVIEDRVKVGEGTILMPGVYVGAGTTIGEDCVLWPNVTVRNDIEIGNRVIINPGSVIGCDGFGFAHMGDSIAKLPQIGTVLIEDDVEIGACVTIDRARFDKTVVSRWTKLDNLVQLAHNVKIGKRSMLAAQVGIAGSTELGDDLQMGGQSGASGHLKIGSSVFVAGRGGLTKDHPDGIVLSGMPARERTIENKIKASVHRLPALRRKVMELEERLRHLEKNAENDKPGR